MQLGQKIWSQLAILGEKYVSEYGQTQIIMQRITVKLSEREQLNVFCLTRPQKSLCLIEVSLEQEAGYLSPLAKALVGAAGADCSARAGAGFRAVIGHSALPGAAAARSGARDSPWLPLFSRGTVCFPCHICPGQPGVVEDKLPLPTLGQNFLDE